MTRRDLLQSLGVTLAARGLLDSAEVHAADALTGTQALTWNDELSQKMMDGAHRFVERKIQESKTARQKYWHRDFSSRAAYETSVADNRRRFTKIIGATDARLPADMERFGDDENPALVAEAEHYRVHQVRWPVFDDVSGQGLLFEPKGTVRGYVVALPDADQTPEQIAGLASGIKPESQFARSLAENGFEVVVPVLIDRTSRWSGHPDIRMTDQSHREWIYRQAFHMGRHIIGYEVQKVLAAVDWFRERNANGRIGVAGYGEGGLIAFYSAAVDSRIESALVSGYFDSRQAVWSEPIYRNVWALLHEFGDAEIASLLAPRALTVEFSSVPEVTNQKGDLKQPKFETVKDEFARIDSLVTPGFMPRHLVHDGHGGPVAFGSKFVIHSPFSNFGRIN